MSQQQNPRGNRRTNHTTRTRTTPEDSSNNDLILDHTGVTNLDIVLGGGVPRGSLVLVIGPPGSGKTTLACQMAFAAAAAGRRAAIVTAVSEPSTKLIAHLRSFRFYDDHLVGDVIQFMSLEQFLPSGLHATGDEIIAIARQTRAEVIVLDGFRGIRGAEADQQAARQFLYDVGSSLSTLGVTIVISSEADPHDPAFFPEATAADTIIGLYNNLSGVLQRRGLEIVKVRGGAPLSGLHGLALDAPGVLIYPRLEALVSSPLAPDPDSADAAEWSGAYSAPLARKLSGGASNRPGMTKTAAGASTEAIEKHDEVGEDDEDDEVGEGADAVAAFGVPGLDALLGGGLSRGTSTLLIGSLGAGKTFLALHFALAGAAVGEPTLFVSFRETRRQLRRKVLGFVLAPSLRAALAPGGGLTLQHWNPVELHPDVVADRLLAALDRRGARRLVVDSIAEIEHALARSGDAQRTSDYLAALMAALHARDITALFIKEHRMTVASELDLSSGPISALAENVLLLQQLDHRSKLHRVLSVIKMRYSGHDARLHEVAISQPLGVQVLGSYQSTDEMMATVTHHVEGGAEAEHAE